MRLPGWLEDEAPPDGILSFGDEEDDEDDWDEDDWDEDEDEIDDDDDEDDDDEDWDDDDAIGGGRRYRPW
jgi:hypothetical protein